LRTILLIASGSARHRQHHERVGAIALPRAPANMTDAHAVRARLRAVPEQLERCAAPARAIYLNSARGDA
jgi:hypothetical protein